MKDVLEKLVAEVSRAQFGMTREEAWAKRICINCKTPVSTSDDDPRFKYEYEVDALCRACAALSETIPANTKNVQKSEEMIANLQRLKDESWREHLALESLHEKDAVRVRLAKLTICSCGESMFNEQIGLGIEYKIWPESVFLKSHFCGQCGTTMFNVPCVFADQKIQKDRKPALIPLEVFDYDVKTN